MLSYEDEEEIGNLIRVMGIQDSRIQPMLNDKLIVEAFKTWRISKSSQDVSLFKRQVYAYLDKIEEANRFYVVFN